jgi:sugar lactone lactonase YvrE
MIYRMSRPTTFSFSLCVLILILFAALLPLSCVSNLRTNPLDPASSNYAPKPSALTTFLQTNIVSNNQQWTVSAFAGGKVTAYQDGVGVDARINMGRGLVFDSAGNLFSCDNGNYRIRKTTSQKVMTTFAGTGTSGSLNGYGISASFNLLQNIAIDPQGNLLVCDGPGNLIRKIAPDGAVGTFAGTGTGSSVDGVTNAATFNYPMGIAVSSDGTVYVSEYSGCNVRKISTGGNVTTLAGFSSSGYVDANGTSAGFMNPTSVAVTSAGVVFVAEFGGHRIRKIMPNGDVTTLAGNRNGNPGYLDAQGTNAYFNAPYSVAVDAEGTLFVGDLQNRRIRKIDASANVTTICGNGIQASIDGIGTNASLSPTSLRFDNRGDLYVSDNETQITKVSPSWTITTNLTVLTNTNQNPK